MRSKLFHVLVMVSSIVLVRCVSAGDKTLSGVTPGSGSTCAQYCRNISSAGCPGSASCEAECKKSVIDTPSCADDADRYYTCAAARPVTCNADGSPSIAACAGDQVAFDTCTTRAADSGTAKEDSAAPGDCTSPTPDQCDGCCTAAHPAGESKWSDILVECVCAPTVCGVAGKCKSDCEGGERTAECDACATAAFATGGKCDTSADQTCAANASCKKYRECTKACE